MKRKKEVREKKKEEKKRVALNWTFNLAYTAGLSLTLF
jgi:hypothetical protein